MPNAEAAPSTGFPPLPLGAAGKAFNSVPPFTFTGVTMRSFPLRANLGTLQRFIDSYLNIIPEQVGRFRVVAPYVNFMLLDYGKMDITVRNVGWLAQHEIVFNIPLAWYTVRDGRWLFKDWATLAPFIYVDDDMSMATGRSVYGWTKAGARLAPALSDWIRDVHAPITDATVITKVFPKLYAGAKFEERVFIEVRREAPVSIFGAPFDPKSPLWPWNVAANLADGMAAVGRAWTGLLGGAGLWPLDPSATTENALAIMGHAAKSGFPLRPTSVSNPVNLKQFRQSEKPADFCFQAVTNGPMRMLAFNQAGPLGEDRLLLGDTSGGYTIRLHDWPSLPIVATLGLEVNARWRGEECDIVDLKPTMPSWADVDMVYEQGCNLAWRERDGVWHGQDGTTYSREDTGRSAEADSKYVTTLGASQSAVAGPFRFARTTIRVLPLLARRKALDTFLNGYLNDALEPYGQRFKLWGAENAEYAYVYLTVSSFGDVTSTSNSIGDWAKNEVAYHLPVRFEKKVDDHWTLVDVGLVPAQTLVDNARAAASNNEILGISTQRAQFIAPEDAWMGDRGPRAETLRTVLQVVAEVAPALGEGEQLQYHRVLEIAEGNLPDDVEGLGWRLSADQWAMVLRNELLRKKRTAADAMKNGELRRAREAAVNLLRNGPPFNVYTLKQFPDITDPTTACYQSLVRVRRSCEEVLDCREIETPLVVRIQEFPSNPIVTMLGLVAKQMPPDGPGIRYAMQPFRPFWLHATINEALGDRLLFRGRTESSLGPLQPPAATPPGDSAASELITMIDPQMVIETLLSGEWGNWSDDRRWRAARRTIDAGLVAARAAVPETKFAEAEADYFRRKAAEMHERPGHLATSGALDDIPKQHLEVEKLRDELERSWERLSAGLAPSSEAPWEASMQTAVGAFLAALRNIEQAEIPGDQRRSGLQASQRLHDNRRRLKELADAPLPSEPDGGPVVRRDAITRFREALELARERSNRQREALRDCLAREWQKPAFVVRRDSAGPDRDRLFPRSLSWDDDWYSGPAA